MVEDLFQQFVVEYLHVVLVHIVDNDLIEDVDIEQLIVVLLYVGADNLVEYILINDRSTVPTDVVVNNLHEHCIIDHHRGHHVDITEGHTTVEGDEPCLRDAVKPDNRSYPVCADGLPVRTSKQHTV